ncbi:MAG: hypothetical protein SF339_07385 [Blastocatellia bacterium]|nr:hypothetical protein [Blastocatellia bacterium]
MVAWIEDDADEIAVVVKPLLRAGIEFRIYHNYTEAIESVEEIRAADLILLDLIIPPGSAGPVRPADAEEDEEFLGKTLFRELRATFDVRTPVIVLSVVADNGGFSKETFDDPPIQALAKPIRPSVLKTEVLRALGIEP